MGEGHLCHNTSKSGNELHNHLFLGEFPLFEHGAVYSGEESYMAAPRHRTGHTHAHTHTVH